MDADLTEAERKARNVLVALDGAGEAATDDELEQLRADAAVGRALREAVSGDHDEEPLIHIVIGETSAGTPRGRWLGDPKLAWQRRELAEAAQTLLDYLQGDDDEDE